LQHVDRARFVVDDQHFERHRHRFPARSPA
jgi:hypothetical protein